MREPAGTLQALDYLPGQVALDRRGRILTASRSLRPLVEHALLVERPPYLRDVLELLEPRWARALPEVGDWHGEEQALTLLEHAEDAVGVELTLTPTEGGYIGLLHPRLAAPKALEEASVLDVPPLPQVWAEAFLRLKRAEGQLRSYHKHFPGVFFEQHPDLSLRSIGAYPGQPWGRLWREALLGGGRVLDLIDPQDRDSYIEATDRHRGQPGSFSVSYRVHLPGLERPLHLLDIRTPRRLPSGVLLGFEGVWLDITRQAVAERCLTSAGWKENIAQLTAGLLHDFKNSMTGIGTSVEHFARSLEADHPWSESLQLVRDQLEQSQGKVAQIMELTRETAGERRLHDARALLSGQEALLRLVLPKHQQLSLTVPGGELPLCLALNTFRQLLLNLVLNASEASAHNGAIRVSGSAMAAGDARCSAAGWGAFTPGREGLLLQVEDAGCGIEAGHLAELCEPYFTTKEAAQGAGLGLFHVRRFVEAHQGHLAISSTAGQGTLVSVFLPATDFSELPDGLVAAGGDPLIEDAPQAHASALPTVYLWGDVFDAALLEALREERLDPVGIPAESIPPEVAAQAPGGLWLVLGADLQATPERLAWVEAACQRTPKHSVLRLEASGGADAGWPEYIFSLPQSVNMPLTRVALQISALRP